MLEETKITTNFWVLFWSITSAVFIIGTTVTITLNAQQTKRIDPIEQKQKEIAERVTRNEANYEHIIRGIDRLTIIVEKNNIVVERNADALATHRAKTEKKKE